MTKLFRVRLCSSRAPGDSRAPRARASRTSSRPCASPHPGALFAPSCPRVLLRSLRPRAFLPRALARRPVTCVKFSDTKVHPGCPRIACPPRSSSSHLPFANRAIVGCSRAAHWGKVGAIATRPRRLPRGRRSCGRDRFVSREELGKHRCGHRARRAHREHGRPAGGKTRRTVRPRPPSCPHRGARHCARHGL